MAFVNCGAVGAITGIGNCIPKQILHLVGLCEKAAAGDVEARRLAKELDEALIVLSTFDEGPDLVLFYKYLLVLLGDENYRHHFNPTDKLSSSQAGFAKSQLNAFLKWWDAWPGREFNVS